MSESTVDPIYDRASVIEQPDGTIAYRASSFGYCIGALVRARLGITPSLPPEFMEARYQEGHDWERDVLTAGLGVDWLEVTADSQLTRLGEIVEGRNGERQIETALRWSNKLVTCHPDAIVQHRGEDRHLRVCEVKFLGPDMYNAKIAAIEKDGMRGLGPGYAYQASIEMLSTGLPMLYIIGQKKMEGEEDERRCVGLAGPPVVYEWDNSEIAYTLKDIKMRVAEVEGWVARGEMPPCVVPFDYPCGYWQDHEKPEKVELTDEVLVDLVESYGRAKAAEERHKAEADRIKADIDARLTELQVDGGECGGWEIARTAPRKGNVSWANAWKALPADVRADVDVEQYRGAEVAAGVRMTRVKDGGK